MFGLIDERHQPVDLAIDNVFGVGGAAGLARVDVAGRRQGGAEDGLVGAADLEIERRRHLAAILFVELGVADAALGLEDGFLHGAIARRHVGAGQLNLVGLAHRRRRQGQQLHMETAFLAGGVLPVGALGDNQPHHFAGRFHVLQHGVGVGAFSPRTEDRPAS